MLKSNARNMILSDNSFGFLQVLRIVYLSEKYIRKNPQKAINEQMGYIGPKNITKSIYLFAVDKYSGKSGSGASINVCKFF